MASPAAAPGDRPPLAGRFATRLVLAAILAVVPLTVVLAVVLVSSSSGALRTSSRDALSTAARTTVSRLNRWTIERRQDVRELALELDAVPRADRAAVIGRTAADFEAIQLLAPDGRVLASRGATTPLTGTGDSAFVAALRGGEGATQPALRDGTIRTLLTRPIGGTPTAPGAILVVDLDEVVPAGYLYDVRLGRTGDADYRIKDGALLWAASSPRPPSPRDMAATAGVLRNRNTSVATRRAQAGDVGAVEFTDYLGRDVVGGYAASPDLGWAVAVKQDRSEAFSAVADQRRLALLIGIIGALLVIGGALLFARRLTAPVSELAAKARAVAAGDLRSRVRPRGPAEVVSLGESFNEMVTSLERLADQIRGAGADMATSSAELSSAAQELAATTNQQSAAATQTSSTMEELAQTSARIAESVDVVAGRTEDTRRTLRRVEEGIADSGDRVGGLAERAVEIGQIVTLINDVADRTDLLALNAAIEAARAGEVGAGFAVVAEEVRLLAERTKAEAAKIGEIVARTQAETNAMVLVMDGGAQEMHRGVELMDTVSDSTSEVRLTTDQQRLATDQVVATMVSVTTATRQTATTAQQIAQASRGIAELAAQLQDAAFAFRTDAMQGGTAARTSPPSIPTYSDPSAPRVPLHGGPAAPPAAPPEDRGVVASVVRPWTPSANGDGVHHPEGDHGDR